VECTVSSNRSADVTLDIKSFQIRGATTGKGRLVTVDGVTGGNLPDGQRQQSGCRIDGQAGQ